VSPKSPVCAELEEDLVATASGDAAVGAARRVQSHVERCAPCRDELQRYRVIEGEVSAMRGHALGASHVALARDRLEARLSDLRSRLVAYRIFASPFGPVLIARSEQGVLLVEYLDAERSLRSSRLHGLPRVETVEDGGETEALYRELREYLDGRRNRLDWPLDLRLVRSDFHRDVLRITAAIPYGAVVSYAGLAREVGRPQAVRAAAQALRWNPLPIVIPCHRVIGSSGALTGYAGGETSRKQKLLAVEGIPLARARNDFRIVREEMYVRGPGDTEYCLPTCPSVDPFPLGGTLFGSRERAEAAGFAPCTTCRPDLHPIAHRAHS
jgi:methylated-DNA-[protein]-cysteine S-methyltransferase